MIDLPAQASSTPGALPAARACLQRVRTRFGMRSCRRTPPASQPRAAGCELLALAAPDLDRIGSDFQTVRELVVNHEITVLATDLLLKTALGKSAASAPPAYRRGPISTG